jgi:hypothetical protein
MADKPPSKNPLQSKKFVAFLVAEATWKVILGAVLIMGMTNGTIGPIVGGLSLAIIIIAGAIEITYVSGQAALDKYTRIASIVVGAGQNFSMKGVELTSNGNGKPKLPAPPTSTDAIEPDDG